MIAKSHRATILTVAVLAWSAHTQHANDTLLFSIPLNESSASLFYCKWGDDLRKMLSGPVIMDNGALMFYSRNGYAVYSQAGKPLDYYSLVRRNRRAERKREQPLQLAYPLDGSTVLFYRRIAADSDSVEVYRKGLFRRRVKRTKDGQLAKLPPEIGKSQLFNLANNSITNEMAYKAFAQPHLVGYTSLENGTRWWSIDKFYSFRTPLIVERDGSFVSFFPGLRAGPNAEVNESLVEPLGVYYLDSMWYYYGVYIPTGSTRQDYYQKLFLCDQAGNVLYSNSLLKNTLMDDVLAEVEEEKMIYTVKRAGRHSFLPAVDRDGVIFFGVVDFKAHKIDVLKRMLYKYVEVPASPSMDEQIDHESRFFCRQVPLPEPGPGKSVLPQLPAIEHVDEEGRSTRVGRKDLTCEGYVVAVYRTEDDALWKKLNRKHASLPEGVRRMQDSLATLSTARYPYGISLQQGRKEILRFGYGLSEVVTCARVIQVTSTFEVFVRVDLVDRAEILVFGVDGTFMNRFTFNRQDYRERMDVVVVSKDRLVLEKDYEVVQDAYRFGEWRLAVHEPQHQ